jgi:hypothetical protein
VLFLFCCCCIYLHVLYLYDLFHILLLPLQIYGSMECTYVRMYVCTYVCMYVCMYVYLNPSFIYQNVTNLVINFPFSLDNSVATATRLRAGWPGFDSRHGLRIFLLATACRLTLVVVVVVTSLLSNGYPGLFPRG